MITLDREDHQAEMILPRRKKWFEAVRTRLLKQETIRVPYFVQFDNNRRTAKRVFFNSLAQFFTLLQNPSLTPVTYIDQTQLQGGRGSLEVVELLREKSRVFSEQLMKLRVSVQGSSSLDVATMMEQLKLFSDLLNTGDFEAVDLPWLKNLRSGKYESGWQQLFVRNFDGTVEVIAELIQIIELLEKSRI